MNPFRAPLVPAQIAYRAALVVGVALWVLGISTTSIVAIGAAAVCLIAAGAAAIVAGRSRSAGLILVGIAALGIIARAQRNDALRARIAELEKARGATTWHPDISHGPMTFGAQGWYDTLSIGNGQICYSGASAGAMTRELRCTSAREPLALGVDAVGRAQFSGDRLLWASTTEVGVIQPSSTLKRLGTWKTHGLPRALAGTHHWAAWDEGSAVVTGELDAEGQRTPFGEGTGRFDADLPAVGRVILAAFGERLLFGPTTDCSVNAIDLGTHQRECLMHAPPRLVAANAADGEVALAFEDGELFSVSAAGTKRWGQVAELLAMSLTQSQLFVITKRGVSRLGKPGGPVEPLFAQQLEHCEAAGDFGELLAWHFGNDVRVIRRDAKPLEPFELR